ncbi:hypothetical protein P4132_32615 [Pseudomonas aeruginosa]|nr:hypothetical protein [Pseudomonas aeruginosa]
MKLKNFLQPFDSGFSTPSAALKLLRMLGGALMLCVLCSLIFSVSMVLNHQVSLSRQAMNVAMYEAQLYFEQREALLNHLSGNVVPLAAGRALVNEAPNNVSILPLSDGGRGLLLTARTLGDLREKRLALMYLVDTDKGPLVYRLTADGRPSAAISSTITKEVYRALLATPSAPVHWVTDGGTPQRLYLFESLGDEPGEGWLGLEILGEDLDSMLRRNDAGNYMLLDQHGQVVLATDAEALGSGASRTLLRGDGFGFIGAGPLPQHMVLFQHVGSSSWDLIYHIGIGRLLLALWLPLLLASALALAVGILLHWLVRSIERRLIEPAKRRLEALKESEAFFPCSYPGRARRAVRAVVPTPQWSWKIPRRANGWVIARRLPTTRRDGFPRRSQEV